MRAGSQGQGGACRVQQAVRGKQTKAGRVEEEVRGRQGQAEKGRDRQKRAGAGKAGRDGPKKWFMGLMYLFQAV